MESQSCSQAANTASAGMIISKNAKMTDFLRNFQVAIEEKQLQTV